MRRASGDRYTAPMHPLSRQAGVTLVEVLLASALAGFALLALAMLHSHSLRGMEQAQRQVEATFLLQDFASRMQANPAGRASYAGFLAGTPTSQGCSSTNDSDAASVCNATDLAEHDAWMWTVMIEETLGEDASAVLTSLVSGDTSYKLTLSWAENNEAIDAELIFRLRPWIP